MTRSNERTITRARSVKLALVACLVLGAGMPAQATHESVGGTIKSFWILGSSCPTTPSCTAWQAACTNQALYDNVYKDDKDPLVNIRKISSFTSSRRRADFTYLGRNLAAPPPSGSIRFGYYLLNADCEVIGDDYLYFNSGEPGRSVRIEVPRGAAWIITWVWMYPEPVLDANWRLTFCHAC